MALERLSTFRHYVCLRPNAGPEQRLIVPVPRPAAARVLVKLVPSHAPRRTRVTRTPQARRLT